MNYSDIAEQLAWEWKQSLEEADKKKNTLSALKNKQKSIKSLFPTFDERVNAVNVRGVYFQPSEEPGVWKFLIKSGTDKTKSYDAYLYWNDLKERIREKAKDRRLWNKDKTKIDLNQLAREILTSTDLKLKCGCPAFTFWGPAYQLSQRDAKYTEPETRKPVVRNPKLYGMYCKHLTALMQKLPWYSADLAKHIRENFSEDIAEIEGETKKEVEKVQQTAQKMKEVEKEKAKEVKKEVPKEAPKDSKETPKETPPDQQRFRRGSV